MENRRSDDAKLTAIQQLLEDHIACTKTQVEEIQQSIQKLSTDTKDIIDIYKNVRSTFLVVNSIQKFGLWLLKWSPIAALFYFSKDVLNHFYIK